MSVRELRQLLKHRTWHSAVSMAKLLHLKIRKEADLEIRKIPPEELYLLAELDRSEKVTQYYRMSRGKLECADVDLDVPQWVIEEKIEEWRPIAGGFKNMWGALLNGRLAGFVVYRRNLTEHLAQLSLLHVSRDYRGKGIGTVLMDKAVDEARKDGKAGIYVSSCPSRNTVDFYMRRGFIPASEPNAHLFEMEPEDIHMIMDLSGENRAPNTGGL